MKKLTIVNVTTDTYDHDHDAKKEFYSRKTTNVLEEGHQDNYTNI